MLVAGFDVLLPGLGLKVTWEPALSEPKFSFCVNTATLTGPPGSAGPPGACCNVSDVLVAYLRLLTAVTAVRVPVETRSPANVSVALSSVPKVELNSGRLRTSVKSVAVYPVCTVCVAVVAVPLGDAESVVLPLNAAPTTTGISTTT